MIVTTYAGEKQVGDIAKRVFGELPAARLKVATEALLAANPNLMTLNAVTPGAIIIVPALPGPRPKQAAAGNPTAAAVGLVVNALEQYQQHLVQAAKAEQQEVKNVGAQLKSPDVNKLVAQFDLKAHIASIEAANKARDTTAKDLAAFAGKVIPQMQTDLQALIDRLG